MNPVVSSTWLHNNLNNPALIILDASPKTNVSGLKSALDGFQIPEARYLDLAHTFSDQTSTLPNTLLKEQEFESAAQNLGINKDSIIVVYDNLGIYTSPRVWWMFRIMGHQNIAVLDGGLPSWHQEGFSIEPKSEKTIQKGDFQAKFNPTMRVTKDQLNQNLQTKQMLVLDARSTDRFSGEKQEPREGLRSGHIPYSKNLPYPEVLDNGKFKPKKELEFIFRHHVPNHEKPMAFTCGSGITACIIMLASELVLPNKKAIYDGSWTEWGQSKSLPIAIKN